MKRTSAFTLVEVIITLGIMLILAVIFLIFANPQRRLASARNVYRTENINKIYKAIFDHANENDGQFSPKITGVPQFICNDRDGVGTDVVCEPGTIDLRPELVQGNLSDLPADPEGGTDANTRFTVMRTPQGKIVVAAPYAELNKTIRIGAGDNYAIQFDNIDDSIRIPHHPVLSPASAVTISMWVKQLSNNSSWQFYIAKGYGGGNPTFILGYPGGFMFELANIRLYANAAPKLNTWYYLTATYDGTVMKIYVDGELKNSTPKTGPIPANMFDLKINGDSLNRLYTNAVMDEVRIYDRALDETEIQQLYKGIPINSGIIGYWSFDEGSGTSVNNGAGVTSPGTFLGAPQWINP